MKFVMINACSDLGLDVDGSSKGPLLINKKFKNKDVITIDKINIKKSKRKTDLKKNLKYVNIFNKTLYNNILKSVNEKFFVTIGGDHSISIASALGSQKINKNLGIIWIDAHLDYNTFETTITGNLHGFPLAALNGICPNLTTFYDGKYFNPKNTVVIGYRANEPNKEKELNNIKKMGVTVFTSDDIKKYGIEHILNKAINIASFKSNGIHVSFDLDVIDPFIAPGVSIPEKNGIDLDTTIKLVNILKKNIDKIKSFDLMEFNPDNDIDNKTLNIALEILKKITK